MAHARDLKQRYGFTTHKLKGGHFAPDHDISVMEALAAAFPNDLLRLDPNGAWSVEQAIRVGHAIEKLKNDYFEDPTWGLEGMRRVRQFVRIPTATNTVVVNFEQLAQSVRHDLVDVVLLDTTFWGGLRQAHKAGAVLKPFNMAPPCIRLANLASSSLRCSISARRSPISALPPTRTIIISRTIS